MRLLILTQYYPPEIGAPQNRIHELAVRLIKQGVHVEVITAMPNYPVNRIHEAYKNGKIKQEYIDGVLVHRSRIYVSLSKSIISRLLNYFSFVFSSYFRGRNLGDFDYLFVESPPLFLGYSAMRLSKRLKAKLVFNVSDLWPESAEKLNLVNNKFLLKLAYQLEAKCYSRASLISVQTNGILENIKSRFPEAPLHWLPNGVDLNFYDPGLISKKDFRLKNGFSDSDLIIFYGGILGHAQGLEVIIKAAEILKDKNHIKFVIQGAGPEKEKLLLLKHEMELGNIYFLDPVSKKEMPAILKEVDLAVVPLKKLAIFEGAIPSKIFEALAMEIPLILGVKGESKEHFIDKAQAGLFFEPENYNDLAEKIILLSKDKELIMKMGKNGRSYVMDNFNRDSIANTFLKQLKEIDNRQKTLSR
jgi:glycosyltransferase involved in cell wall biosynthesis